MEKLIEDMSANEIESKVRGNCAIMKEMLGTLYPSILSEENTKLRRKWSLLTGRICSF